jgi:hypothetical protein
MKKNQKKKFGRFKAIYLLWIFIVLLVISQIISFCYIAKLQSRYSDFSQAYLRSFVNEAERRRYKDPIVDVSENRVYIPEARVYVPLTQDSINLKYDYRSVANSPTQLYLSLSNVIGSQTETDSPTCDKMIMLNSQNTSYGDNLVAKISPTKDGFQYIYSHDPNSCSIYFNDALTKIQAIAREIQSY